MLWVQYFAKTDRMGVVEKLSYDGNLSKQMPLEPSYICFFFCANLNVITHTRNEKKFSPNYLLFDDTLTQHLVYAIKMAGVILYRLVKHHGVSETFIFCH